VAAAAETLYSQWAALSPPSEARAFHDAYGAMLGDAATGYGGWLAALKLGSAATDEAPRGLEARWLRLHAQWIDLAIRVFEN
jgi:hypothetical protein